MNAVDLLNKHRPNWATMTPDSLSAEVALEAGTPRGEALAMLQAERTIAGWCEGLCDE
jgi:hypothetical protein